MSGHVVDVVVKETRKTRVKIELTLQGTLRKGKWLHYLLTPVAAKTTLLNLSVHPFQSDRGS